MFNFFKPKKLYVEKIQEGKLLDKAKPKDVSFFFSMRMQNRLRKVNVGNWEVLFEGEKKVYFGFPKLDSLFNSKRIVEDLYWVDALELERQFSHFQNFTGVELRELLMFEFSQQSLPDQLRFISMQRFKAKLHSGFIAVKVYATVENEDSHVTRKYQCEIDLSSLTLKSIKVD